MLRWHHFKKQKYLLLPRPAKRQQVTGTSGLVALLPEESSPQCSELRWEGASSDSWHRVGNAQSLSRVQLSATPWTVAYQASPSFTVSWSFLKLMSTESMMPSNHFTLCHPLSSCLQSFPGSGSFPMSQLFASGGQSISISASTSVLPTNTQN